MHLVVNGAKDPGSEPSQVLDHHCHFDAVFSYSLWEVWTTQSQLKMSCPVARCLESGHLSLWLGLNCPSRFCAVQRYRERFSFGILHPQEHTHLISSHCSFEVNFLCCF